MGLGLTYTMQRDASFACMSGTTVYLRDAQKGGLRLSTWEAIKEAAVPGLVDALMALHHPLPIAPTIIRHVWKQGLSHLDDDPGALQLLVLPPPFGCASIPASVAITGISR